MATMNVSLPDAMKEWVESQTQTGRYGNASDYVRDPRIDGPDILILRLRQGREDWEPSPDEH